MKKLISMLVAIAAIMCLFLSSCGAENTVESFAEAVRKTEYAEAVISTETVSTLGTLEGSYTVSISDDGSATVVFTYETWCKIDEGSATDIKQIVSGTVVKDKDGNYSGDTESLNFDVSSGAELSFDLLAIPIGDVNINEDGTVLEATVSEEDTKAVFGREYGFDVTLKVVKTDGAIASVEMSYSIADVSCTIVCAYS